MRRVVPALLAGLLALVPRPGATEQPLFRAPSFKPFDGRPASSYKHDEVISVRPHGSHPITAGIGPFRIFDETYKGLWISPRANVLLETDNPTSDGPVLWTFPHPKARVVYLQLGHGPDAHRNSVYRRLVRNSVLWAAGRLP